MGLEAASERCSHLPEVAQRVPGSGWGASGPPQAVGARGRVGTQRRCLHVGPRDRVPAARAGLGGWAARARARGSFICPRGAGGRGAAGGGVNAATRRTGLAVGGGGGPSQVVNTAPHGSGWGGRRRGAEGAGALRAGAPRPPWPLSGSRLLARRAGGGAAGPGAGPARGGLGRCAGLEAAAAATPGE